MSLIISVFNGVNLPFEEDYFDNVICRYAFHHFPCYDTTLEEIARTLKHKGIFILADAIRNEEDRVDFINRLQELKEDGHVRMYKSKELIQLVSQHGFKLIDCFESFISFRRKRTADINELLKLTPPKVRESYSIVRTESELSLTFKILNAIFENQRTLS